MLYEITNKYQLFMEKLDDHVDMDEELKQDMIQAMEGELEHGIEELAKAIRNEEALKNALREEEKRLAEKRHLVEKRIETVKGTIHEALRVFGVQKVKAGLFSVWTQKNPASVEIKDVALVPDEFIKYEPKVDKKELGKAIKEAPEKFAELGIELKQSEGVRVR